MEKSLLLTQFEKATFNLGLSMRAKQDIADIAQPIFGSLFRPFDFPADLNVSRSDILLLQNMDPEHFARTITAFYSVLRKMSSERIFFPHGTMVTCSIPLSMLPKEEYYIFRSIAPKEVLITFFRQLIIYTQAVTSSILDITNTPSDILVLIARYVIQHSILFRKVLVRPTLSAVALLTTGELILLEFKHPEE